MGVSHVAYDGLRMGSECKVQMYRTIARLSLSLSLYICISVCVQTDM